MPILVHSVPMSAQKFTREDVSISKKYINPEVYPGLYDPEELPKGVKFLERKLIDIDDFIIDDSDSLDASLPSVIRHNKIGAVTVQSARVYGRGKEADNVFYNIRTFGYKLDKIPMSIAVFPDGKKYMINGRTRLEELKRHNFKNIIVDVYDCSSLEGYHEAKQLFNVKSDPYSPHTMEDIVFTCRHAIKMGWTKSTYDAVRDKINKVAPGCFSESEIGKIINRSINDDKLSTSTAWTTKTATEYARRIGYVDNKDNNGIYYFVYSAEGSVKVIPTAARYLKEDLRGKKVKELRIIIHTGTLQGADPEASWKNKIDACRNAWKNYMHYINDAYFPNSELSNVIKLYGALPAVSGLSDEYPMDRLVMFHVGKLKNRSFAELSFSNGLMEALDVDDLEEDFE